MTYIVSRIALCARGVAGNRAHEGWCSSSARMTVMSVPLIRLRPLAESDLPTIVEWFAEPREGDLDAPIGAR